MKTDHEGGAQDLTRVKSELSLGAAETDLFRRGLEVLEARIETILRFPMHRSSGKLCLTGRTGGPWEGWKAEREARGVVAVPSQVDLTLEIKAQPAPHLSFLANLDPAAFGGLTLSGAWQMVERGPVDAVLEFVAAADRLTLDLELDASRGAPWGFEHLRGLIDRAEIIRVRSATDGFVRSLIELNRVRHLYMGLGNRMTDVGASLLGQLEGLERLGFESASVVSDRGLEWLGNRLSLEWLSLKCLKISDLTCDRIALLPRLEKLDLSFTPITDAGLLRLTDCLTTVTFLGISCGGVGDRGLAALRNASHLEHLGLVGTQVTSGGVKSLEHLQSLRDLRLASSKVDDRGVPSLAQLRGLETLYLSNTKVTAAGLDALGALQHLRYLDVGGLGLAAEGLARLRQQMPHCDILARDVVG